MAKTKAEIVARFPYATVKKTINVHGRDSYDIWQWNVYKMKWVRMSNSACGFGTLQDASRSAQEISDETETMLRNNQSPPPPL